MLHITALTLLLITSQTLALEVGQSVFGITATNLNDNQPVALENFAGDVLYIDFWATWCTPCRKSLPFLSQLQREYTHQGFRLITISQDDDNDLAKAFIEPYQTGFISLADPDAQVSAIFGVQGMPTSYLIDQQGTIRWIHQGFKPADQEQIRTHIEELLETKN